MGKKKVTISLSRRVYDKLERKREKNNKDRSNFTEDLLEQMLFG